MLLNLIIQIVLYILAGIFFYFPPANIANIPIVGQLISNILITMMQTWNAFMVTFPYAVFAWHMLLWVVIPFEIGMLIMKFFLGHHIPAHLN